MRFRAFGTLVVVGVALPVLGGCAQTQCWTMAGAVAEDVVGESTAREALEKWLEQPSDLSTDLPASDWVETTSTYDSVSFKGGGNDWADASLFPGGWIILTA